MSKIRLTPKQEKFCQLYMTEENGTRAYFKAYNCTLRSAEVGAHENLRKPKIKARINELRAAVTAKTLVSVESVVNDIVDTHRRAKEEDEYNAELKASDMLMRHVGGYERDNEQQRQAGTITDVIALMDSYEKQQKEKK